MIEFRYLKLIDFNKKTKDHYQISGGEMTVKEEHPGTGNRMF